MEFSGNYVSFYGEYREERSNLVLLRYIGCGGLVQDGAKAIDKRFIFLSYQISVVRKQVDEE